MGIFRIKLGNGHDFHLEIHDVVLADVHQGCIRTHPGCTGGGVDGENASTGIQKVSRIAVDLEGRERSALRVNVDLLKNGSGLVVEDENIARKFDAYIPNIAESVSKSVFEGFYYTEEDFVNDVDLKNTKKASRNNDYIDGNDRELGTEEAEEDFEE